MTIQGGSASAPSLTFSGDTNTGIFSPAADTIAIGTGGTEAIRVDSARNVGLGVTPSAWFTSNNMRALQLGGGSFASYLNNQVWLTNNYFLNSSGQDTYVNNGTAMRLIMDGAYKFQIAGSGTAGNAITFTQAMTLDASGNLLVGTTSSPTSVADGNASTNGMAYRANSTGCWLAMQNESASTYYASKKTGYTDSRFFQFSVNATGVGSITTNGTSTTYGTSSDYRLKENIQPMQNALAKVAQLKPCTYTWKFNGAAGDGFIAHELQSVVPDCVIGEKDAVEVYVDEEGNEQTRPIYQGIDTSYLVATLTAAIQELKAELDATKAEVALLKGAA
jgi:hypothetical protein